MDLEKTEARNDCAGEGQQEFNLPTDEIIRSFGIFLGPRGNAEYPNELGPQSENYNLCSK
jgi:hypothetical protein